MRAMTDLEHFEVKAEAFRIMTGHMAPGKDASAASYPASYDERLAAWTAWYLEYGHCASAMCTAFERLMLEES